MKKLILFLLPLFALAQNNPFKPPYGIQNTVATENNTPTYFVTQETDGVHKKTPAANIALKTDLDLKQTVFTGICQKQFLTENDFTIDNSALTLTISTVKNGTAISAINPVRFFTDGSGIAVMHEKTSPVTFNFTNTTGIWYFYFDSSGNPIATQTPWTEFSTIATVYRFYWNATLGVADRRVIEAVEFHKNDVSWVDHAWKHLDGAKWSSGLTISSNAISAGTPAVDGSNAVITLSSGTILDDNIYYTLTNASTGSVKFTQNLGTGLLPATSGKFICISNSASGLLEKIPATDFPFLWNSGTNTPEYLTVNGTRTAVTANNYFVYYVYALQDPRYGETIKIKSAETDFANLTLAQAHNWEQLQTLFPTLRDGEIRLLYKLTFEYKTSYDVGTKKSVLRYVDDLRKQKTTTTAVASGTVPATNVSVSPVGGIAATNVQSALQELDSEKQAALGYTPENVANKATDFTTVNNTLYPSIQATKTYVDSKVPATYATIVYVNSTSPNTATIFDDENPPVTNDDAFKLSVDNLYIGTDASSWVYNGSTYVTKVVPATSNFNLYNTAIDAGNNKESIIERFGVIASKSGNIVRKNGSDSVLGGGYFSFYNNAITSGNTFQLNASNGLDLWNFASGSWNKRFTFSSDGYLTANLFIKKGGTSAQFLMADGSVTTGSANSSPYSLKHFKTYFSDITGYTATGFTPTYSNGKMIFTGGTGDFSKYISIDGLKNTDENIESEVTFKASVIGYGVSVGKKSINSWYSASIYCHIDPTGSVMKIWDGQGLLPANTIASKSIPTINANDIIKIKYSQLGNQIIFTYYNLTQGTSYQLSILGNLSTTKNFKIPNSSEMCVFNNSGTNEIISVKVTSFSNYKPDILVIGDSKSVGYSAKNNGLRWANNIGSLGTVIVNAGDGDRTVEATQTVDYTKLIKAKYAIIAIGRNDLASGVASGTWQTNYANIVTQLQAQGTTVFHLLPVPETTQADQSALSNWITTTYGVGNCIDVATGWSNATMLSSDNIHPNEVGHAFIAKKIIDSGLIVPTAPIQVLTKNNEIENLSNKVNTNNYIPFSDNGSFSDSEIYRLSSGKYSLGTTSPYNYGAGFSTYEIRGSSYGLLSLGKIGNTTQFYFSSDGLGGYLGINNNGSFSNAMNAYPDGRVSFASDTFLPEVSAKVEVRSTTKGFLPPRMTNAQRLAIASPAIGLMVYCTDTTEGLYIYKSTGWTFIM